MPPSLPPPCQWPLSRHDMRMMRKAWPSSLQVARFPCFARFGTARCFTASPVLEIWPRLAASCHAATRRPSPPASLALGRSRAAMRAIPRRFPAPSSRRITEDAMSFLAMLLYIIADAFLTARSQEMPHTTPLIAISTSKISPQKADVAFRPPDAFHFYYRHPLAANEFRAGSHVPRPAMHIT